MAHRERDVDDWPEVTLGEFFATVVTAILMIVGIGLLMVLSAAFQP